MAIPIDKMKIPHPFTERDEGESRTAEPHVQKAQAVYERSMFELSWNLRQKSNWYEKIKDPIIIGKWRKEALDQQAHVVKEWRLTSNMVDYVLKELENYAKLRDGETGIEHACDDSVFWSRALIPSELTSILHREVTILENVADDKKDWHPNSNNQVLNLVHPSLYPIVYGRTYAYVQDPIDPLKTEIIQSPTPEGWDHPEWSLSTKFCWLPSDFHVSKDGTVQLMSPYINNIHQSSTILIGTITDIISHFVPMWERVLGSVDRCNRPDRDVMDDTWSFPHRKLNPFIQRIPGVGTECIWLLGEENPSISRGDPDDPYAESEYLEWSGETQEDRRMNWLRSKILPRYGEEIETDHPPPTHQQTEDMRIDVSPGREIEPHIEIQLLDAVPPTEFRSVIEQDWRVADLRDTTLQVIVKLANIELTPQNPEYPGGSWHVEGMLNERIASTGIYYYDSENITESHLAFRCCIRQPESHAQDDHLCMKWMFDLEKEGDLSQTRGEVPTNKGTCLAFPNIYQHFVSPFKLVDPTKPGHRKILALFLVDPTHPIPSATSVPPQRQDWVMDTIYGDTMNENEFQSGKLPVEITELILDKTEGLMSWKDALAVRQDLMAERKSFVRTYNGKVVTIGFDMCEH